MNVDPGLTTPCFSMGGHSPAKHQLLDAPVLFWRIMNVKPRKYKSLVLHLRGDSPAKVVRIPTKTRDPPTFHKQGFIISGVNLRPRSQFSSFCFSWILEQQLVDEEDEC